MNNRITNLQEVKSELQKITLAIDKALASGRMCDIERDIVMERLRAVYDAIPDVSLEASFEGVDVMSAYLANNPPETVGKASLEDSVEIRTQQEILHTDTASGVETTIQVKEEVKTTLEELLEDPLPVQPPIAREIIESLYGDAPIRKAEEKKSDEMPASEKLTPENHHPWEKPEEKATLFNDTIGESHPKDVASMLSSQAVSDLRHAIGLNDRFLLLSDLFNQNGELYEQTLDALERMESIEDAYIYLYEHFTLDDSKEGVKRLIELLEAKFN